MPFVKQHKVKLLPTLLASDSSGKGSRGTDLPSVVEKENVDWEIYRPAITRWETKTRLAPHRLDAKGRLNAAFAEWMMGAPEGYTAGISRTAQIHGLGNGVVVQVAEYVGQWALEQFEKFSV